MAQGANRVAMIWATASELVALAGGLIMRTDSCSRPALFWNRTLGMARIRKSGQRHQTTSPSMHKSPAISLNSRSFRFQTHGRKGQGAEGCGQGPGWVQILEPNREKHLNDIRKKTCAHASCKTCSAPASPPRRPNRKIPSLLSCSSDRHRPPRRCLGASCHCPRTTLGPVNHTTRMRTQVAPSPPFE
jgi:hypothetical protein